MRAKSEVRIRAKPFDQVWIRKKIAETTIRIIFAAFNIRYCS